MADTKDKNLSLIERELRFIARHSQQIEGSFDVVHDINLAIVSALRALDEYTLSQQPACEEIPVGLPVAA